MSAVLDSEETILRVRELLERGVGSPVLVLGGGVTGRAVSELLWSAGYDVTIVDEKALNDSLREELVNLGVSVIENFSATSQEIQKLKQTGFGLAVLSPGVSLDGRLSSAVTQAEIPKVSELDLGIAFLGMPKIAVTGTNGKTTTTSLINDMLNRSGVPSLAVGNIGKPFVSVIRPEVLGRRDFSAQRGASEPVLVAEVSSYQLEGAFDFSPHIGVWLNLTDDHLERHGTMEEYLRIKSRIFSSQNSEKDYSIIFVDDPWAEKTRRLAQGKFFPIGYGTPERLMFSEGCFFLPERNEILFRHAGNDEFYGLAECSLVGDHNKFNLCGAIAAARLAGATVAGVEAVIREFKPLEHRIEFVAEKNGVVYINDSKATNVSATVAALSTMATEYPAAKVILLLGGKTKKGEWSSLTKSLPKLVKGIIVSGGDRDLVMAEVERCVACSEIHLVKVDWLPDAVGEAAKLAKPGDIVLFAPACASFDAYSDYTARGRHFRELVGAL